MPTSPDPELPPPESTGWLGTDRSAAEVGFPDVPPAEYTADDDVALVVMHGMGQQVRFETLEQLAGLLHRAVQSREPILLRRVLLGDQEMTRAEVRFTDDRDRARCAHLYEAYWAPLAEGKVGISDVFAVLAGAAAAGFKRTFREFDR